MNINTLSSYTSLCACGHHMCSLPCIKVYTHTCRYTSTERPVLRNRLTWSRRLGCPWSAICKLVVSLAYPSPEAPEQQHGCCEWAVSLQAWGPACGAGSCRAGRWLCGSGTPPSPRPSVLIGLKAWGGAPPHWGRSACRGQAAYLRAPTPASAANSPRCSEITSSR